MVIRETGVVGLEEGAEGGVVGGEEGGGWGLIFEETKEMSAAGAVEVEE